MKICHVITRMIVGGAQENTLYTLRGHLEHGHESILVTGPTYGPEGNLLEKVPVPRLRVIQEPHLRREVNPWHDIMAFLSLKKIFLREKFDVVHTHSSKAGVLGRLAAKHANIPLIVHTVHGPSFHHYQAKWKNALFIIAERMATRVSDRCYAVADAMQDRYVENKIGNRHLYKTVYSGMDLEPFLKAERSSALGKKLGIKKHALVVGKVARLFELKGYEFLLQSAPYIVNKIPEVQFLIVGDGIMRSELQNEVKRLGLQAHFIFAGLVDPFSIHHYIAWMDVVVHLSLREGLPRSVVQASAAGKPTVGFALDGTPEVIIHGKTGFLCPPKDSTDVGKKVISLLKNREKAKKMGQQGREFVSKRWDWKTMSIVLEKDYAEVISRKQQAKTVSL